MLERHELTPDGRKADREWWFATKLAIFLAMAAVAGYVVGTTVL